MADANKLQFKLGDAVSVFAVKSYQSQNGNLFEAVGNVVIIHQENTLYGESASIASDTGKFKIEGNVRYISKDITIYGSRIDYDLKTTELTVQNARINTGNFNIVAKQIVKKSQDQFVAYEAEYSTCKDCPESWTIYGKEISLTLNEYVTIKHALFKANTINIMYIPYLILPAKRDRETGLLFPKISSRVTEGISLEQPWFWAIDDHRDMTISPTFWAKRGYGLDLEYRHLFNDTNWMQINSRLLDDDIYLPYKLDNSESGQDFFRHFSVFESHIQKKNRWTMHSYFVDSRDIDIIRDHPFFTDNYIRASEIGLQSFVDYRGEAYSFGIDAAFNQNLIYSEPTELDSGYVQLLPKFNYSVAPVSLYKGNIPLLNSLSFGIDSNYSIFKQDHDDEAEYLRNANRLSVIPYLQWNIHSWGPYNLNSKLYTDFQHYNFEKNDEQDFQKYANRIQTEFSVSFEKIFGLAYEERVKKTSEDLVKTLEGDKKDKTNLIGQLEDYESLSNLEYGVVPKFSYKHIQNYKMIHHWITKEGDSGNDKFREQIKSNKGWFDYVDSIRSRENLVGSNETRTVISPQNTLEFQWNNKLVRKSPKSFNYFDDQRYLRDNFNYDRIGYFDVSQGYKFYDDTEEGRLTRLYLRGGYTANKWNLNFEEYYFHDQQEHFFKIGFFKDNDMLKVFTDLNINSFSSAPLKNLSYGFHLRPSDLLGFTLNYEYDLENKTTLRSFYAIDYLPPNNCWKMVLGYRKTIVDNRISFDWVLNFGNSNFSTPNTSVRRL